MNRQTIVICILLHLSYTTFSQISLDDSTYKKALHNTKETYLHFIKDESPLYNGPVFHDYQHTINEGNPYFKVTTTSKGQILYNGILYKDVPLLYDILNNKLIISKPGETALLFELDTDKVADFYVLGHHFIQITNTKSRYIPAGFYEILFEGKKSCAYQKYIKEIGEDLSGQYRKRYIADLNTVYIKKGGHFYKVSNKKGLLKIYKDQQQSLKAFLRKNNLDVKKNTAQAIKQAAVLYDKL